MSDWDEEVPLGRWGAPKEVMIQLLLDAEGLQLVAESPDDDELERLQHARDTGLAGEGTTTPPRLSVGATAFRPGGGTHEVEPARGRLVLPLRRL